MSRTETPAVITAVFTAHPEATLVLETMGHGYGKAKYNGRCRLTGGCISRGESIRRVVIWTHTGNCFEGIISNRALGMLAFFGHYTSILTDDQQCKAPMGHTTWRRFDSEAISTELTDVPVGTRIDVVYPGDFADDVRSWSFGDLHGKWRKHGSYNDSSTKQLAASFRRAKRATLYRVIRPR